MSKFCIMSALKSDLASSGKKICECDSKVLLAFDAEDVRNTTIRGGVIVFRCSGFKVDKEESTGKWNEAFGYKEENDMVVITINPDYRESVIVPYFAGKIGCWLLSAPFFLIKNRK